MMPTTTAWFVGATAACACWLAFDDARAGTRRLTRLSGRRFGLGAALDRWSNPLVVASGLSIGLLLAAMSGPIAGFAAGSLVAFLMLRARAAHDRRRRRGEATERRHGKATRRRAGEFTGTALPAALDLLAACLCGGATLEQALQSVADAVAGDVGDLLGGVVQLTVLGAPPETAWAAALADPNWAPVARAVIRAHHSGASLTEVLTRVADDRRRSLRADAEAAAGRAAVRAVVPLGLCFLPAFLLVGVVPVVAGFAGSLWG